MNIGGCKLSCVRCQKFCYKALMPVSSCDSLLLLSEKIQKDTWFRLAAMRSVNLTYPTSIYTYKAKLAYVI